MGKKKVFKETTEEILKESEATEAKMKSKKESKGHRLDRANVYIQATYNNTIITITDLNGNVVATDSAGAVGFKGPKKATPFAASRVVESLLNKIKRAELKEVFVFVKGVGSGRDGAIRALAANGLDILSLKDITPVPHNGCRPPKPRRV
jgi:small subunit ribosomal protein S11